MKIPHFSLSKMEFSFQSVKIVSVILAVSMLK